ncbi:MAG: T9SS C-terminal target domain-containing protein [Bacteroidetes bacterium]|nr:MAG: T9SS C-terminal target domain-containing protein [Bacteroidota bacterium]
MPGFGKWRIAAILKSKPNPMRRIECTSLNNLCQNTLVKQLTSVGKRRMGWPTINRLFKAFLIGMPILFFVANRATAQCSMVCNDNVNVSLPGPDYNCELEIVVDMVMESTAGCSGLVLTLMDLDGVPLPTSPVVNASHIGETFVYSVTNPSNGNSCWGTLNVEDKLGPTFTGCKDGTVYCLEDLAPASEGGDAPAPSIDDCSNFNYSYEDLLTVGDCNSNYAAILERTWTATDEYGYSSTCTQIITVEKMPIDQFVPVCPPNVELECSVNGQPSTDPTDTGYPQVEVNGKMIDIIPGGNYTCEMAASYQDEVFDICGGGLKILRTWNVYDWCLPTTPGQNPWTCIQIIKVSDHIPPQIDCVSQITEGSNSSGCETFVSFPPAVVTDECSSFSVKIITPFGQINGNGGMSPVPMPVGVHDCTYIATDECGNVATCPVTVEVVDDTPPVAICDQHSTVSLTADGTAIMAATVFDDGSTDNCGIDHFEVSRMPSPCYPAGTPYDAYAEFDCCDAGQTVMVSLRVYDSFGNYNECMVDVTIQDKIDPTLTCPPNKTIECSDPVPPVIPPTVSDNCANVTWDYEEENYVGSCGVGTVFRTYTATDASGHTASCIQQITVVNSNPFNLSNITWPYDYVAFACGASLEPGDLPPPNAEPIIANDACDLVAVTYTDQPLSTNPPACYKVLRNWIVIDWCQFNPNDPNTDGIWEHTQVLKVEDADAPVIDCPDDIVYESIDADCGNTFVTVPPISITDCSTNFDYSYTVDYDSDGSIDAYGTTPDVSGNYPFGNHTIHFTVNDRCGNEASCEFKLNVVDAKKPTPVCVNGIAVDLMPDPNTGGGIIELTASMFDNGSFDNCTNSSDLDISITPTTFRCINLGTNIVTMWVTDEAGNSAYCETYVIIQDNMGACNFGNPLVATVAGNTSTESGVGVGDVMVEVSGTGPGVAPVLTADNGNFEFVDLATGHDYTFTPNRDDNPTNGVTTYDLVLITKHILNTTLLDSPYKIIAADANNSGSVTTLDVVLLRKLILNISQTLDNNTSWRFVNKNQTFSDPNNPFADGIQEFYNVNNLSGDVDGVDFVAIKVGDVNNSANPNNFVGADDRTTTDNLTFFVQDEVLSPGQTYEVAFTAKDFADVFGFQFTLEFDPEALEFVEMTPGVLPLTTANFGFNRLTDGIITTSWNDDLDDEKGQTKNTLTAGDEPSTLFTLTFRANTDKHLSELLQIHSKFTQAEAYALKEGQDLAHADIMGVDIRFDGNVSAADHTDAFQLYQNTPNPFSDETVIAFNLPETQDVTLTIFDVSGKVLKVVSGNFGEGYNEIRINAKDLRGSGVLYYRLESLAGTQTAKMILTRL